MKRRKNFSSGIFGVAVLASMVSCTSVKQGPVSTEVVAPAVAEVVTETAEDQDRFPSAQCPSAKYTECREARRNDVASMYMRTANGDLYRKINNLECKITDNVVDFKISQHPDDVAVLYFKKDGALFLLNKDRETRPADQCPSAKGNWKNMMSNVKKFTVTSSTHTTIVNAALDNAGYFTAWDNVKSVYTDRHVDEFIMNDCFGKPKKSFSSFVLFTRSGSTITKVKVSPNGRYLRDDSADAPERSHSLAEFKKGICK